MLVFFFFSFCKRKKCYNVIEFVWTRYDLCINYFYMCNRDMLPLPYATKDNYKVLLYRLADLDPDKVRFRFFEYIAIHQTTHHIAHHITSNNQQSSISSFFVMASVRFSNYWFRFFFIASTCEYLAAFVLSAK